MKWAEMTAPKRAELIQKIGFLIQMRAEDFVEVLMEETGKTEVQAIGEVTSAADMAFFMAGEGRRMYGDTTTSALPNRWAMTKRYPIGLVGIIVPWNFPLALAAWKVFPALICGNEVLLKMSSRTPKTAEMFIDLVHSVIPSGTLTQAPDGKLLVQGPNVKMVSFTGSTEVGREIAIECAKQLKKCSLELGGKNCAIVLEDADIELAAKCVADGAFSFGGQRCASTSRVVVHEAIYEEFMNAFSKEARKFPQWAIGGKGEFWDKELFEPNVSIAVAKSFEHAIELHNDSSYGLTGAVFTRDINKAIKAVDLMQCGVVYINAPTYGSEVHLPFGGMKNSGNGMREVGKSAIDTFSELKTVYIDYSGGAQNAQWKK